MSNASELKGWPPTLHPSEWPDGTLEQMSQRLFIDCVWPLRKLANVQMFPSPLFAAHVRPDGNSMHSTKEGTRYSEATDIQFKSVSDMLTAYHAALAIPAIGGIGIYFDTNKPMIHIDHRPNRLIWCRVDGEYFYAANGQVDYQLAIAKGLQST